MTSPLAPLFAPRSIAVVGASATPGKAGAAMLATLGGFPGALYPINPREDEIQGRPAYPSVGEAPGPVDLAVLTVPAAAVPAALRDCAAAGVRAAVVCAGGFAEAGGRGDALQREAAAAAREGGLRLLGPNTSGFVNPAAGVRASFVPGVAALAPGPVAVVAQSGGVNHALAFLAASEGLGLRLAVGLGNAVDVGAADVLEHLAADEGTAVVALHLEGVADGRRLFEAVERATERVPVVVLKAGRADVGDFARSHTGALMGSWALARAALAQAGAVLVDDTVELVDAARALAAGRLDPSAAPGVAVVSGQAGPALLVADTLRSAGVDLPELTAPTVERLGTLLPPVTYQRNPVDTGRPSETFADVLTAVGLDPAVDVVVTYALHEPEALDPVAAVVRARDASGVPGLFVTGGPADALAPTLAALADAGVPTYLSPEQGARAARALVADARAGALRKDAAAFSHHGGRTGHGPDTAGAEAVLRSLPDGPLDEHAAKSLLEAVGVRTPRRRTCATRDDARAAAAELGWPVVVKVLDAHVTHKSDVGGVHVGVTPERLDAALDALAPLVSRRAEGAARYLVEEQAPPGLELIVGARRDPSFGPTVLVGLGGVVAEALGDVAVRLAPLGPLEATRMLEELTGRRLLHGFRGRPGVDGAHLAATVVALGQLIVALPELAEVEVNPLRATPDGLLALDAVARRAEPAGSGGQVEPAGSGGQVEPAGSGGRPPPAGPPPAW